MASINPASVLSGVPGTVTFNGLGLGAVKICEFRPNIRTGLITAEEYGNVPVEHINIGSSGVFSCILRTYDAAVYAAIFPSISPNVTTGNGQPGKSLSSKSGVLLFTPDAPSHPSVKFWEAIPLVDDTMAIGMGWNTEWGVPAIFHSIPDSQGRLWTVS